MSGITDLSIEFLTRTPVLIVLGLLVLLGLTVILYLRTNPPISPTLRAILASLRAIAILALVLALLEPVLSFTQKEERPKRIALLLDSSGSMNRTENQKTRQARLDSLLSSEDFEKITGSADVATWYFAGQLATSRSEVDPEQTALGDAISALKAQEVAKKSDYWLVFSDGNSNAGRPPTDAARQAGTPIIAVNLAGDLGAFDFALGKIDFSPVLFVGQPTEITVRFNWNDAAGRKAQVQLRSRAHPLAEASMPVTEKSGIGELKLRFTPAEPGQQLLTVTIPPQQGEETDANNSRTVSVNVLKSRLSVLIVSSRPDQELGFLRRYLLQSDKFDVDLRVLSQRAGNLQGTFPRTQAELNRFDLVILHDPDPTMYQSAQAILKSYLSERGGAIWVLEGDQFAARGPVPWFNDLLPFWQSNRLPIQYFDFHGEPAEENLFHPTVRLADDRSAIRGAWAKVPPFRGLVRSDIVARDATILAYVAEPSLPDKRTPIIGFRRFGPGKLLATAATPFWNWGFSDIGFGSDGGTYRALVDGTSRWMTVSDEFDPVRINPEKEVFSRGETVRFLGFAYDQGYRPLENIAGEVHLVHEDDKRDWTAELTAQPEPGTYETSFEQLPPGQYHFTATLSQENLELKRSEGSVVIETYSLEEFDQGGDPANLMAIAQQTGGEYVSYDEFSRIPERLSMAPVTETQHAEILLWNKLWLLLLFIGALVTEWAIRKMNQLI